MLFADVRTGERTEAEVAACGAAEQQHWGRNQTQQVEPEAAAGNTTKSPRFIRAQGWADIHRMILARMNSVG